MLSVKLVRSLILGETIHDPLHLNEKLHHNNNTHNDDDDDDDEGNENSHPCLIFLPTNEIIHDTYRLAIIARDMGMNFSSDPSLSNIVFSWPSSPKHVISLPFPSLSSATFSHLRRFARVSKGLFKLVPSRAAPDSHHSHSLSLFDRVTRHRVDDMDAFSRLLASSGWSLFKTNNNSNSSSSAGVDVAFCVFRKVEPNRVRVASSKSINGDFDRVKELRMPALDFRNAPLRVLHYLLLMTDGIFYLA